MAAYVTLTANLSPFLMLVIINCLTFKLLKRRVNQVSMTPRLKRCYNQAIISLIIIIISYIFCHGFEIVINITEIHNILTGDITPFQLQLSYFYVLGFYIPCVNHGWVWWGITNTVVFYFRSNMVQIQLWSWSCFLHSQNSWLIQLHHLSSQGILSLTVKDTTPFFNFFNIFDFFYQYFIYFICIINWCNEYNLHSRKRGLGKNISVVSQKIKQ